VNSYQNYSFIARRIDKDTFLRSHAAIISQVLLSPKTKALIVGDGDSFSINAFMVYEDDPQVIHYVYVREALRKLGIMKTLLNQLPTPKAQVTHWTRYTDEMYFKHKNFTYNPYLFYCEGT
jgi:hypothetical protein